MCTPQEVYQGELTNMKAQLGRPSGLALVLLATLLATFLAMGVFTVAQASGHSATRSISPMEVTPGGEVTVEIALSGHVGESALLSDTLPDGFSFVPGSIGGGGLPGLSGNRISVVLGEVGTVTEIRYKAMAPDDPGGPFQFSGSFIVAGDSRDIGGDQSVTVAAAATGGNGDNGNGETGDQHQAEFSGARRCGPDHARGDGRDGNRAQPGHYYQHCRALAGPKPSRIPPSASPAQVSRVLPRACLVTSSKITMTVPQIRANGDPQTMAVSGAYSIRIKQAAGISNPASGGDEDHNAPGERPRTVTRRNSRRPSTG